MEGSAKHCRPLMHFFVCHASFTHCAVAPEIQAICPAKSLCQCEGSDKEASQLTSAGVCDLEVSEGSIEELRVLSVFKESRGI